MSKNTAEFQADEGVSAATAAALRSAMATLLAGKPRRTDGRLIKENLWKEAGVSRATMNRAQQVLTEWDTHVTARGGVTAGEARRDTTIGDLKRKLAGKTRECTLLQQRLDAAATAIAALHHDNTALREQLDHHSTVRSLATYRDQAFQALADGGGDNPGDERVVPPPADQEVGG